MTGTLLVLSRHGQTVWHGENRYAGHSDIDMTPDGHGQAQLLAQWAQHARPGAIACSPLRRATETAAPAALALGLTPLVLPDLREVTFGIAEGRTIGELSRADPQMVERFRADPVTHHFPGAEDPADAAQRAAAALCGLAGDHPGATVLVIGHNTVLRLALCRLLDIDVRRYRAVFPRLDNGALTSIVIDDDEHRTTALLSLNVPLTALSGP